MKTTFFSMAATLRSLSVAAAGLCLVAATCRSQAQVWSPEILDRYLDYQRLNPLTAQPIHLGEAFDDLCLDPKLILGPHLGSAIHLFANTLAVDSRRVPRKPENFPIGSLLVKEKFAEGDLGKPSLITVMEKTADKGRVSDWRFLMIRLPEGTVVHELSAVSCAKCHSRFSETGFVSPGTETLLAAFSRRKDGR